MHIDEAWRKGILGLACGSQFREFRFFRGSCGRGIDDFGFRQIGLEKIQLRLGNFDTFFAGFFLQLVRFLFERGALLLDAFIGGKRLQAGLATGFTPSQKGLPSHASIAEGMRGQGIEKADDVKGGEEKKREAPDEVVDGFTAKPESEKSTRALDAEVGFPIGQKQWLELEEAGSEQDHEEAPWGFVTQAIAGQEPLCEAIANGHHRQQIGRTSKEKKRIPSKNSPQWASEIRTRSDGFGHAADERCPAWNGTGIVTCQRREEVNSQKQEHQTDHQGRNLKWCGALRHEIADYRGLLHGFQEI